MSDERIFSVSEDELEEIPSDILSACLTEGEVLNLQILELFRIAERPLNVKEIIIGLYKKFGVEVEKRNHIATRLYRLSKKGFVSPVKSGRGKYKINTQRQQAGGCDE